MPIEPSQIRSFRLRTHHLDRKIPLAGLCDAAGACGLQNSPPGAWETALFNRLEGCSLAYLHNALYKEKKLLQAWSYRGAPVVFPTSQSSIFLTPLLAQEGEEPWIYTTGITAALQAVQMSFDDLFVRTKKAVEQLDGQIIKSKETLDSTLAEIIERDLPMEKRPLWRMPSMYGQPDRQTVGGAAVSFLLRPCSFSSLVVFGQRQENFPTFTSFKYWIGHNPDHLPDGSKHLVRKFLHCYGPTTRDCFMNWLGCSLAQAKRLWNSITEEMEPVLVENKSRYILSSDRDCLLHSPSLEDTLVLLGAHDPYLDLRDRTIILENKSLHKFVWKTVANPGAILKNGRIIGIWKTKTRKDKIDISMNLFESVLPSEQTALHSLGEEYAAFRQLTLRSCQIEYGV